MHEPLGTCKSRFQGGPDDGMERRCMFRCGWRVFVIRTDGGPDHNQLASTGRWNVQRTAWAWAAIWGPENVCFLQGHPRWRRDRRLLAGASLSQRLSQCLQSRSPLEQALYCTRNKSYILFAGLGIKAIKFERYYSITSLPDHVQTCLSLLLSVRLLCRVRPLLHVLLAPLAPRFGRSVRRHSDVFSHLPNLPLLLCQSIRSR